MVSNTDFGFIALYSYPLVVASVEIVFWYFTHHSSSNYFNRLPEKVSGFHINKFIAVQQYNTNLAIEQYKSSKKSTSFILQTICKKKSMEDTNKAGYDNIHKKTLLNFNY